MKFLVQFCRVIVGLLFILSGLLKLNDPTGFSYKLEEYFTVFADDVEVSQDTITIEVSIDGRTSHVHRVAINTDSTVHVVFNPSTIETAPMQDEAILLGNDTVEQISVTTLVDGIELRQDTFVKSAVAPMTKVRVIVSGHELSSRQELLDWDATTSTDASISGLVRPQSSIYDFFIFCKGKALFFAIFVSWLEAILGFALLIGWQRRFTVWMIAITTIFFTFLTWYSWHYDKVTDCGCFGDALPMNPEESFYKNLVIGALILILIIGNKRIKPIFSNPFGVKFLTVTTILLVGFSLYCWHYLPVVNFLKFKDGANIRELMSTPEGERTSPHVLIKYRYVAKDGSGAEQIFTFDSETNTFTPKIDYTKWKYDAVASEEVIEEAYTPPIHDFKLLDENQEVDHIEEFWQSENKLLIVFHDLEKANVKALDKLKVLAAKWNESGYPVWALTASSAQKAEEFRHTHQISEFDFHYGDNTQLKSIIRSNPGLLLITDSATVQKQWPSTRLPNFKKLERLIK